MGWNLSVLVRSLILSCVLASFGCRCQSEPEPPDDPTLAPAAGLAPATEDAEPVEPTAAAAQAATTESLATAETEQAAIVEQAKIAKPAATVEQVAVVPKKSEPSGGRPQPAATAAVEAEPRLPVPPSAVLEPQAPVEPEKTPSPPKTELAHLQVAMAPVPEETVAAPVDELPTSWFAWRQPVDDVVTPFAKIRVEGEAPNDAQVVVKSATKTTTTSGQFSLPWTLEEGVNRIEIVAKWRGKVETMTRTVTVVDLDRVDTYRARISAHRDVLQELESTREDLAQTLAAISGVIPTLPAAMRPEIQRLADELRTEMDNLANVRSELGGDIDRELSGAQGLQERAAKFSSQ